MRRIAPWAVLAVIAMALMPATAHTSQTKSYVAGTGDVALVGVNADDPASIGCDDQSVAVLGGACFAVGGHRYLSGITIDDATDRKVGGAYRFFGAAGGIGSAIIFCQTRSGPIVIPGGATQLAVFVDTANGPLDCPNDPPGVATTGTITLGLIH